jgi:hypothetical protein
VRSGFLVSDMFLERGIESTDLASKDGEMQ